MFSGAFHPLRESSPYELIVRTGPGFNFFSAERDFAGGPKI